MAKKLTDHLKQDKSMKAAGDATGLPPGTMKLAKLPGHVKATLGRTDDMSTLELCLVNDGKRQRLFVAGNHDVAQPTVRIPAGKEIKVKLATCCMDKVLSGPASGVEYRITSKEPRPQDVQAAATWMRARNVVAGNLRTSDVDFTKYALQHDFVGSRPQSLPEMTKDEADRKSRLHWVQKVCWNEASV